MYELLKTIPDVMMLLAPEEPGCSARAIKSEPFCRRLANRAFTVPSANPNICAAPSVLKPA